MIRVRLALGAQVVLDSLFELADTWVISLDASAYVSFLKVRDSEKEIGLRRGRGEKGGVQ